MAQMAAPLREHIDQISQVHEQIRAARSSRPGTWPTSRRQSCYPAKTCSSSTWPTASSRASYTSTAPTPSWVCHYVEGCLQIRKYTDKNGIARYATDIIAENMQMLGCGFGIKRCSFDDLI